MTAERRKAVLFLSITLVIGILIGALLPGLFYRFHSKGKKEGGEKEERHSGGKRDGFVHMIYKTIHPDSVQKQKIEPILKDASEKIEKLEAHSNEQLTAIMDSVKVKLLPILNEKQKKSFEKYISRNQEHRHGKESHGKERGRR